MVWCTNSQFCFRSMLSRAKTKSRWTTRVEAHCPHWRILFSRFLSISAKNWQLLIRLSAAGFVGVAVATCVPTAKPNHSETSENLRDNNNLTLVHQTGSRKLQAQTLTLSRRKAAPSISPMCNRRTFFISAFFNRFNWDVHLKHFFQTKSTSLIQNTHIYNSCFFIFLHLFKYFNLFLHKCCDNVIPSLSPTLPRTTAINASCLLPR